MRDRQAVSPGPVRPAPRGGLWRQGRRGWPSRPQASARARIRETMRDGQAVSPGPVRPAPRENRAVLTRSSIGMISPREWRPSSLARRLRRCSTKIAAGRREATQLDATAPRAGPQPPPSPRSFAAALLLPYTRKDGPAVVGSDRPGLSRYDGRRRGGECRGPGGPCGSNDTRHPARASQSRLIRYELTVRVRRLRTRRPATDLPFPTRRRGPKDLTARWRASHPEDTSCEQTPWHRPRRATLARRPGPAAQAQLR